MKRIFQRIKDRAGRIVAGARRRWPALDHMFRTKERYDGERGDRLGGAVTYFGFLSFFPLVALAFAALGYIVGNNPDINEQVQDAIESAMPGLADQLNVDAIARAKQGAGIIGLLGLLWAGTGWVDALREAMRAMFLQPPHGGGNIIVRKVGDVFVLMVLGGALLASVAISSLATSATKPVLRLFELDGTLAAQWGLRGLAIAAALLSSALIFIVMFKRLSGVPIPRGPLLKGALLGAVGFEILKMAATFLIGQTTTNPVYATFAVAVGLLVWINLVTRLTLWSAAWTATATPAAIEEPPRPEDMPAGAEEQVRVGARIGAAAGERQPETTGEGAGKRTYLGQHRR